MQLPPPLLGLCERVRDAGGRAWVVGGWVRDLHLGTPSKDVDVEVHGLDAPALERVLGQTRSVGRSFGVYKLRVQGQDVDVALPRRSQTGPPEPHMGLRAACRRRDLTLNALAWDPLTQETADFFGGLDDLRAGVLREVDPETWVEDPVRALRAVQFAARLGFGLAPSLSALCRDQDLGPQPRERVRVELEKLLLAPRPGLGVSLLRTLGLETQLWPGRPTPDALDHVAQSELSDPASRLAVQWALVMQDAPDRDAALDALDVHRWSGVPVRTLALRIAEQLDHVAVPPTDPQLRAAADRVDVHLLLVALAALHPAVSAHDELLRAAALGVAGGPLPVLLSGRDLQAVGVSPGPAMGQALQAVRRAQHDGVVDTTEQARAWVRSWLSQTPAGRL